MHIQIVSVCMICHLCVFTNRIVDRNHEERPSAKELLDHPFLKI